MNSNDAPSDSPADTPKRDKGTAYVRGLYKRNGAWYSRIVDVHGRLIRRRLSADKATAMAILGEMRKTVELQRAGILPQVLTRKIDMIEELWSVYMDHIASRQRSKQTIVSFNNAYRQVIIPNKIKFISDITPGLIAAWSLKKLNAGVRGQTVNYYISIIRHALQWGLSCGHLHSNPLENWQSVRRNEPKPRRDLKREEVVSILEAEKDSEWRLRWNLYFYTGLRSAAGAALAWEWIDWESQFIVVPVEHNKSRRTLHIPIHRDLYDCLLQYRLSVGSPTEGMVFKKMTTRHIVRRFHEVCRRANVPAEGVSVHAIRHTVATMLYEATNQNLKAVQELLGHSQPSTTMQYLHINKEMKRAAVAALDYRSQDKANVINFPAAVSC